MVERRSGSWSSAHRMASASRILIPSCIAWLVGPMVPLCAGPFGRTRAERP